MLIKQCLFEYPNNLRELYSCECINYRKVFNERMQKYLDTRVLYGNDTERNYFLKLSDYSNFLVPANNSDSLTESFDVITTAGIVNGKRVMFVEDWPINCGKKMSSGKTSTMLSILGLDIPYERFNIRHFKKENNILRLSGNRNRIISSDLGYVFVNGGFLCLAPVVGEHLIAQWDIARHIERILKSEIDSREKKRTLEQTRNLENIGNWTWLDTCIFADNFQTYQIDILFSFNKTAEVNNVNVANISSKKDELRNILSNNPCYHYNNTDFWKINLNEHRRRLDALIECVDESKMPKMYRVGIPSSIKSYKEMAVAISDKIVQLKDS